MAKQEKTNVMRTLERLKVPYREHCFSGAEGLSGAEVAAALGEDPRQAFKTLVTVGKSKTNYVFMIPVAEELDLKKCAAAVGEKKVEMIHVKELLGLTGYVRGGCSPIGMKKKYPTYIDEIATLFDRIYVSAGMRGQQVILSPEDLRAYTDATFVDLTKR